jgi:excisionase family DNA binding protein
MTYSTETDLLTIPEAARVLRIKTSTLKAWRLARKHLPFRKVGGKVLIRRDDINRFINESVVAPENLNSD